jgi:type I restriction enzyme R subunit
VSLSKWYALARTQQAVLELRDEIGFFNRLAAEVRKITSPTTQASQEAEQAVRQFMSEGLGAGEIVDVLGLADRDRPEISVLSDEFLDSITTKTGHENLQRKLLQKLLDDEVKARRRTNHLQAKRFSEEIEAVLLRYEQRQLTSQQVVEELVLIAKRLRDAGHRHEELGLTEEEAAFYDALAGGVEHLSADPELVGIAHDLVQSIRRDLSVDWTDRESSEAKVRTKVKRLLRRHRQNLQIPQPVAVGGGDGGSGADPINYFTQLVMEQAKSLYRYWPEVGDRLFADA